MGDRERDASGPRRLAELAGCWAIGVAWPIFQGATSGPDSLTRPRVDALDLLIFSLAVLAVVPLLAWLAEAVVARFSPMAARWLHAGLLGLLLGLAAWQGFDETGLPAAVAVLLAAGVAAAIAVLRIRTEFVRTMTGILALATPVVLIGFLISAPARAMLQSPETPAGSEANGVPVVVMAFDEFPLASIESAPGRIASGFPNFRRLTREGTWYPNVLSVADVTTTAMPAILAGRRGAHSVPPVASEYPDNLFTLLDGAGYEVHAKEKVADLCPHSLCPERGQRRSRLARLFQNGLETGAPFPLGISDGLAGLAADEANRLSTRVPDVVDDFIGGLDRERRGVDFAHVMLPHVPWMYLPDGRTYDEPESPGIDLVGTAEGVEWDIPQPEIDSSFQRQQLQVRYADRLVGRTVERLKELGVWDDTLFVVVADHGASFGQGLFRRLLDRENAGWILPVPLFIKYPGQEKGRIDPGPAETLDVLPTILDVTGVEPTPDLEGSSLLRSLPDRHEHRADSSGGEEFEMSRDEIEALRAKATAQRAGTFRGSLWATGGHPELIGKPAEGNPRLSPVAADFESPWPEATVDPGTNKLPAYVSGTIEDGADAGGSVAVALNGVIVGTVEPWTSEGATRFAITLPPDELVDGKNEIALFRIGRAP